MIEFINYLKSPIYSGYKKQSFTQLIKLFFVVFIILFPISGIINVLNLFLDFKNTAPVIEPILGDLLLLIIIGPIIEETFCRFLLKPYYNNIIIFIILISIFSIYSFIRHGYNVFILITFIINVLLVIIINKKLFLRTLQRKFIKHFPVFFFLSAISFGLLHLFNYQNRGFAFYLFLPIITLPQIITGLFFAYVRMKKNILTSLFFHAFINFLANTSLIIHYLFNK